MRMQQLAAWRPARCRQVGFARRSAVARVRSTRVCARAAMTLRSRAGPWPWLVAAQMLAGSAQLLRAAIGYYLARERALCQRVMAAMCWPRQSMQTQMGGSAGVERGTESAPNVRPDAT